MKQSGDQVWRIGDLAVDGRVVLGPMSGYTSRSYREFMKPFGVGACVTEMTSDKGIVHGMWRSMGYMTFGPNFPTGLQLFGSDPGSMAEAAEIALRENPNIDFIDVNMGCPVPKVLRSGSGSALMRTPRLCGDIIREMKSRVGVPVTAKIRLGWDMESINFREVIGELADAGVDAVGLHVRTRAERYAGTPHYDLVEGLQDEMPIPLIISGNIYTLDDALKALEVTGAEAVMVARGGVGNPFLVTQIDTFLRTGERLPEPTVSQQVDWCLELANAVVAEKGEEVGIRKMRCFAPRFIVGCRRCREYRYKLAVEPETMSQLESILEEIRTKKGHMTINSNSCPHGSDTLRFRRRFLPSGTFTLMVSEATMDKYRAKAAGMTTNALRVEIAKLEENLLRVRDELYALDTSPESLDPSGSFKSKRSSRQINQRGWDARLGAAIHELESRNEKYVPSEGMREVYETASKVLSAVRIVYVERREDGKGSGYDIHLDTTVPPIGTYPLMLAPVLLTGETRKLLESAILSNRVYEWHPKYVRRDSGSRRLWILDFYTPDGTKVGFRGNVYDPYSMENVRFSILMAVATQVGYDRMHR